jgi:lysophospholipase
MTLVSIPANPVPEDAVSGIFKARDGVSIRFARWPAPPGRKGTVCVFHGRTEFVEKYFEVTRELRARGFAVATMDWRGQGGSQRLLRDPRKGHVTSFTKYGIDLDAFMKEVVLPDCPPPYYAVANSMGATILIRAAAQGRRWFERMVLCAPMIKLANIPMLAVLPAVARTLRFLGLGSNYVPGGSSTDLSTLPFLGNKVTSDPVRHARTAAVLETAPELGLGAPTIAWVDAAFRAMAEVGAPTLPMKLRQPMLVIACAQDRLVSNLAIEDFGSRLRVGSHLLLPGAKHEIMMEQEVFRSQFWAAFDAYVPGSV